MTRACPSCGSRLCDGIACHLEPDPDVIEFWANFDELRKRVDAERIVAERKQRRAA